MEINTEETIEDQDVVKPTIVEAQESLPEQDEQTLAREYQAIEAEVAVKGPTENPVAFEQSRQAAKLNDAEKLAEANKLSKIYNVPAFFVAENLEKFRESYNDEFNNYDEVSMKSKRLTKWMEDPKNATIAKGDDLNNLAKVEGVRSLVKAYDDADYVSYGDELKSAASVGTRQVGTSVKALAGMFGRADAREMAEELARDYKAMEEQTAKFETAAMVEYNKMIDKEGDDITNAFNKMIPSTEEFVHMRPWEIPYYFMRSTFNTAKTAYEVIDLAGKMIMRPRESTIKAVESFPMSGLVLTGGFAGSVGGFFTAGPGGALAGGAVGAGSTGAFLETGSWFQTGMVDRDLKPTNADDVYKALTDPKISTEIRNEALRKGITLGVVDGVMQVFGAKFFTTAPKSAAKAAKRYAKKSPTARIADHVASIDNKVASLAKGTAVEMAGESASEGLSQAAAYLDFSKVDWGDAAFEGLISPIQSGATSATASLGAKARARKFATDTTDLVHEKAEAEETLQTVKALQEINNIGTESTTQQLDSETFAELTQNTALGDSNKKVYFQKSQWDQYWESRGEDPTVMFEELLGNEIQSGSTVEIGLKEFVQTFTGTDNYQQLLEIVRQRPDGMTVDDAMAALKNLPKKVNELAQLAQEEITRQEAIKTQTRELRKRIQEDIKTSGNQNSTANSEVLAGIFESMAQDFDVPVEDIVNEYYGGIYSGVAPQEGGSQVIEQKAIDTQPNETIEVRNERITGRIRQRQFSGPIQEIASSTEEAQRIVTEPTRDIPSGRQHSQSVRDAAKRYADSRGADYVQQREYVAVDTGRAARIAEAYSEMQHDPSNPEVQAAYQALIEETLAQYQVIKETGLQIEVITEDMEDPYGGNSQAMIDDVLSNNHLWLYPTDSGFGTLTEITDNPLLGLSNETIGDFQLTHNDIFRIVHDYFGHVKEGVGFRARGEENAWQSHVLMYSKQAARAMTTETRGQNSWLNFGPFGEANRTAKVDDTVFADQKVGLLPDWVMEEGLAQSVAIPYQAEPTVLRQQETPKIAPVFFSGLARNINEKIKGAKATKDQVKAVLRDSKKDEVEWLGIQEFVDMQEGNMIEKQALLDFIESNGLQVVPLESTRATAKGSIIREGELAYRETEWGSRIPVVADSSLINFELEDRNKIVDDQDVRRALHEETESIYESEVEYLSDEVERKIESKTEVIYLPDGLIKFMKEEGVKFDSQNQPSNFDEFERPTLVNMVTDFFNSDEGSDYLYEYAKEQYLNGESFYGVDKIYDKNLGLEVWVTTFEYGDQIMSVIYDSADLAEYIEGLGASIEGMNVEEFSIRLREAAIENGHVEVDPSLSSESQEDGEATERQQFNVLAGRPKWQQYTVEGGENYREVRMTINPDRKMMEAEEKSFRYPVHFDDYDIVAYMRLKDRESEDGKKILYAEEIQSDWHQQGRERGYRSEITEKDRERIEELKTIFSQKSGELNAVGRPSQLSMKVSMALTATHRPVSEVVDEIFEASEGVITRREANDLIELEFGAPEDALIYMKEDLNHTKAQANEETIKILNDFVSSNKHVSERMKVIEDNRQKAILVEKEMDDIKLEVADLEQRNRVPNAPYKQTEAWTGLIMKRLLRMAAEEGYDGVAWTPAEVHQERWGTDRVSWKKVKDGFVVSSSEQEGGLADGVNIEELAISRGELQYGEHLVDSQESLLEAVSSVLHREKSDRAIKSLSESIWKEMQETPVGKREPRKEGMESFYNKMVPKVATNLSKTLGLKPQVVEFSDEAPKSLGIILTDEAKEKMLNEGFSLFQGTNAWLEVGTDKVMKMFLTRTANASSIIHESAHMYLEMVRDMAMKGNPKAQERFAAIAEEFGVPETGPIPKAVHERFAREFEAYMMNPESKAPAQRYRKTFSHFATFLADIYGSVKSFIARMKHEEDLDIKLNKNVIDIFERMLVSQREVEAAASSSPEPTFNNFLDKLPKSFANKYVEAQERAREDASAKLFKKLLKSAEKKKTKAYKEMAKTTRAKVTEEANNMPIYNMLNVMRYGKALNGQEIPPGMDSLKINSNELALLYPDAVKLPIFSGIKRQNGLPLQVIANAFGYSTPDDLIYELSMLPTRNDFINQRVEQIMGEWTNDLVYDERALRQEAERQVNSLDRSSYIRMEYDFLAENHKGLVNEATRRVIAKPIADRDMRKQAEHQVGQTQIGSIKPHSYRGAERRAAKEAGRAFAKNDHQAAFEAKERQLLYSYMYQYSQDAKDFVDKKNKDFKKFFRKDKDLSKTRDMDLVQGARAMLAVYGLGGAKSDPLSYVQSLKDYNEEAYRHVSELMVGLLKEPKPFDQMTYAEFNDMTDLMDSLWSLSRESKTIDSRGQKVVIDEAAQAVVASIEENDNRVFAERERRTIGWLEKLKTDFLTLEARASIYSFWINAKDGGKPGLARQYLYEPIEMAHAQFSELNTKFLRKYLDILKRIEGRFGDVVGIDAFEINFDFRSKAELIGALYHLGNPSNKRKLLLGYQWAEINQLTGELDTSRWDSFLNRMFAKNIITKEDMDDIQSVWDLNEELKPMIQKANRKIFGFYFREIKNEPVKTPFGEYKGGYVPAALDRYAEPDIAMKADFEALMQGSFANNLPYTGGKGMTIERNENFAGKLDLDLTRMAGHIRDVVKFSTMKPAVIDVFKMIKQKDLSERINKENPATINSLIIPMLNRADKLTKNEKTKGSSGMLSKAMGEIKKSAAMQILAGSAQNIFEQFGQYFAGMTKTGTGRQLKSTALRVLGRSHVINSENTYSMTLEQIKELDPVFAARHNDESFHIQREMEGLFQVKDDKLVPLQKIVKGRLAISRSAGNIAFIGQRVTQQILDADTWTSAFNAALEDGATMEDAVIAARNTLDLTQFSRRPFDASAATSNELLGFFHMFLDYFNAVYNLQKSESAIALRSKDRTAAEKAARLFVIYIQTVGAASAATALVRRALAGRFDLDDDDEYLDEFVDILIMNPVKFYAAMVPVVGPAVMAGAMRVYGQPYEGRISASPAVEAVASAVETALQISNGQFFKNETTGMMDVRTPLSTLGTLVGLPLGPLSKPINYVQKWNYGEVEPTGPVDAARGLVSGQ